MSRPKQQPEAASGADWRPSASLSVLRARAALLERVRGFFAARGVLEVETPFVVNAPVSDVHLHSARVELDALATPRYLHTSPEDAMKRLLASGSGDIVQICHVVRGLERGRVHNPEFTLIEWYRVGFTLEQLMAEVAELCEALLGPERASERLTYREVFLRELGVDPLSAPAGELERVAREHGYHPGAGDVDAGRDEYLEALIATCVGPRLGRGRLTFVHAYPASQAALARLDPHDPRTARRFELYAEGIELANGFEELTSEREQRARFEQDRAERRRRGLPAPPLDERLLAALASGLPPCAGVALGFDRVAMLALGAERIDQVLAFTSERA